MTYCMQCRKGLSNKEVYKCRKCLILNGINQHIDNSKLIISHRTASIEKSDAREMIKNISNLEVINNTGIYTIKYQGDALLDIYV